jgi:hypothetical protein
VLDGYILDVVVSVWDSSLGYLKHCLHQKLDVEMFCYIFIHTSNCLPSHVQWNIGLNVGNSQSKLLKHWPLFPLLIDDYCQVECFKNWFARWKILSLCRPSSLPFLFPFHMEWMLQYMFHVEDSFHSVDCPPCPFSFQLFFATKVTELLMWPM